MFITENFLLDSDAARELYHEHAKTLPIIDYHCHLSPKMVAEDHEFQTITELWLGGDHYKWRAMRANGVKEKYITGDASDWEKFQAWAATVPYTLRNPLYHWTHLELKTAFGIDKLLCPETAREIYDECNALLKTPGYSARGFMRRYNVELVCTTDDPADDLQYHKRIAADGFETRVLPTWRPDKYLANPDMKWLQERHDYFHSVGCRLADHGLSDLPEPAEAESFIELCKMNHAAGWAQQWHYGPLRNVNSRAARELGPDTGFDTIGDWLCAEKLAGLLDALDNSNQLAKTILYNINPCQNTMLAALIANFQDGSCPGNILFGSGWWFNDQLDGMQQQINALSTQGLLSRFVGMLTDSRSFVSYPRHEYFRRLLCNIIGQDIERGLIPVEAMPRVSQMVEDIC